MTRTLASDHAGEAAGDGSDDEGNETRSTTTRTVRRRSRDEPRGWDPAKPSSDDLRSARRAEIARTYADLVGNGFDDVAHRLRHADPENRALLCRSYRRHHLADRHADDGGESDG